jgi:2-C-methyl-D-erythritol 4-phosphate cytidylyltransferase
MRSIWLIVPAAGAGKRFGSVIPKQYQCLLGASVLEHSLRCFSERADVKGIVLSVDANDQQLQKLHLDKKVHTVIGGKERSDSVFNALCYLQDIAANDDLVAVHDAARPCVRSEDIDAVFAAAMQSDSGALLMLASHNTLKHIDADNFTTIDRSRIYQALTPQVFPFGLLLQALISARENNVAITDDASAVELLGLRPAVVIGHSDNIKITEACDLALAEFYLSTRL